MKWHEADLEIRYADTDQMGVLHHASYVVYCEMGRIRMCADLGLPYHELERDGIFMMVVDLTARFRAPGRYGERIYIKTAIRTLKKRLIEFVYEIRKRDGDLLLFSGSTKHLFSKGTEGTITLPAHHLSLFQSWVDD
ncbi:Acyl-CoA thioesterase [Sulfidibacter corallicola]|uniref:Acyl-CoA thioesterase n=1 Tax=Sulfidibacter corallicola TaxID=2818388 RepID=A0A8A4TQG2_SULCO|nr:acyl-CoA thioesterase [Sulfidibacter corallicola]QTD51238.1 acyl-CoA thioesterase [Sulfidibacter corallicola]